MKKKLTEILIVEDEPLIAEDISGTLREAGHGIAGVAHNAEKALELLKTKSPVLVLLDIKIDGPADGLTLARIIKDQFQIPFIFLTSYTDEPTLEAIKELKPHGFIVKPFDDKELPTWNWPLTNLKNKVKRMSKWHGWKAPPWSTSF